ncbi:MAG: hypothetical protein ABIM99_06175 [Candidatus Dojkabacteria bacterium]
MEMLLSILKFIAKFVMYLANGILWCLSLLDIFGIGKALNGDNGKESIANLAIEDMPHNKDLPK